MRKSFVLDTNVLLHNAEAIYSFADNEVVIPIDVIEELDQFKTENTDLGRNARAAIRALDALREKGRLGEGVSLGEEGGILRVVLKPGSLTQAGLTEDTADNRILSVAYEIHSSGQKVVFVSKDINARIKSDALGLITMDFEKQKVDFDKLYSGWREVSVSGDQIDAFYAQKGLKIDLDELMPNEFVLLRDSANEKHTALAKRGKGEGEIVALSSPDAKPYGISARNMQQQIALELLLADKVQLVTLVGRAGTGKTLLALAAGLHKVMRERKQEKLFVTRPIMPLGKDIGYLPGTKDEKLANWMGPIFDNLKLLLRTKSGDATADKRINELEEAGRLEMEALTYIRGRSIPDQFILVDEAQNLTPHEVKTIVSRAGEDTKMVLTGDPYQIDNPYLDSSSNGLTYTAERMKGEEIFGHITLEKSERSNLASIAAEKL
jgi:PhoH-like ATPase